MNPSTNQPPEDPDKPRELLALLDRLVQAGFIQAHGYTPDLRIIKFTARGWAVANAIQDVEAAMPGLTHRDRIGLWNFFRLVAPRT